MEGLLLLWRPTGVLETAIRDSYAGSDAVWLMAGGVGTGKLLMIATCNKRRKRVRWRLKRLSNLLAVRQAADAAHGQAGLSACSNEWSRDGSNV